MYLYNISTKLKILYLKFIFRLFENLCLDIINCVFDYVVTNNNYDHVLELERI